MDDKEKISLLNDLITKNYDAEKGYKEAAEKAYDTNLKRFMENHAAQRYQFGHDIKGEIKALDGEIDKGSSIAGDAHRMWINMKVPMSDNVDRSLAHECIRGEENALKDYQEAREKIEFPLSANKILDDHIFKIKEAINSLEELMLTYQEKSAEENS
jgi:uncharacterized protein (TIGR02284 family)